MVELIWALAGCRTDPGTGQTGQTGPDTAPCDEPGAICTIAGIPEVSSYGAEGVPATSTELYLPIGARVAPDGRLYVLDWNNHRVRRIDADGTVSTVAGTGSLGDGPEGPATEAAVNHPTDVAFDPGDPDRIVVAAWGNDRIEEVDLASGELSYLVGDGDRGDGPALALPSHLLFDGVDLYFTDSGNHLIRRLTDGWVSEVASLGALGDMSDPGGGLALRGRELVVADTAACVVRTVDLDTGAVETIAGTGECGSDGDGGDALDARFAPRDVAVGPDGTLYVADTDSSCVRAIDPDGLVDTIAGRCGEAGFDGDEGPAVDALLFRPFGLDVAADGAIVVADTFNHVVRRIAP